TPSLSPAVRPKPMLSLTEQATQWPSVTRATAQKPIPVSRLATSRIMRTVSSCFIAATSACNDVLSIWWNPHSSLRHSRQKYLFPTVDNGVKQIDQLVHGNRQAIGVAPERRWTG